MPLVYCSSCSEYSGGCCLLWRRTHCLLACLLAPAPHWLAKPNNGHSTHQTGLHCPPVVDRWLSICIKTLLNCSWIVVCWSSTSLLCCTCLIDCLLAICCLITSPATSPPASLACLYAVDGICQTVYSEPVLYCVRQHSGRSMLHGRATFNQIVTSRSSCRFEKLQFVVWTFKKFWQQLIFIENMPPPLLLSHFLSAWEPLRWGKA